MKKLLSTSLCNCELCFRILSGCYDNSLHIWSGEKKHKHLLTVAGHSGPIRGVSWVQSGVNENGSTVVTFIRYSV